MSAEYRILGPLEATVDGRPVPLGGPRQRAILAILLAAAGDAVPAGHLIDEVWGDEPPETAANLLQGYVSHLRKVLGRDAIATRGRGYSLVTADDAFDLHRFERHASAGSAALADGHPEAAARELRAALGLWRGPALADIADEPFARSIGARLDELRLVVAERVIQADLARGRHLEVVAEVEELVARHPLREALRSLQMLALYRCGRQADALAAYHATRTVMVEELGIEPGVVLRDLQAAILRRDRGLEAPGANTAPETPPDPVRTVLAAALSPPSLTVLAAIAEPLARAAGHDLVLATTVRVADELPALSRALQATRSALADCGVDARVAAFTSLAPGGDLARLAIEQVADLLVVDAPQGMLEDARLLSLLDEAPCDVAILVGDALPDPGPVLVPFSGAEHDWAAIELAAWLARALDRALRIAGASTGPGGRDASRLLASASLAVQRGLGVPAEPVIVDPEPEALVAVARTAGLVVVGLTDRWRREGLGRTRTAVATTAGVPTLLVRRGVRPGGLAPRESDTRFTWTIAPAA